MAGRSVSFDIIANDRASKTLDAVGGTAEKTGGRLGKLGGIAKAGALGLAGLAAGAGVLGKSLFDTSINMEAMGNKAKTVFGDWFPDAMEAADGLAQSLGMTQTEAVGLLSGFGDLLIPMGFTQGKALDLSQNMGNLTAALSQWSNGTKSAGDVQEILTGALTGEYDSLKSLGVQIDADTIKTLLHAKGKDKLTGAALKQATAEVALEEITRQSSSAITAYDKGTNKLALSKNKLMSQLKTFRDQLAQKVYPILVKTFGWITDKAIPAVQQFSWWIGPKLQKAWDLIKAGFTATGDQAVGFGGKVSKLVQFGKKLKEGWDLLVLGGKRLSGYFTNTLNPAIRSTLDKVMPLLRMALDNIKKAFGSTGKSTADWGQRFHVLGQVVKVVVQALIVAIAAAAVVVSKNIQTMKWALDKVLIPAFKWMAKSVLAQLGVIINGAAAAFGWVPGLGPKLKAAAKKFNEFAESVRDALDGIPSNKNIVVTVNGKKVGYNPRTGRTTVNNKLIPKAAGGPVSAGGGYIVGENGPEFFSPGSSGTIIPNHALGGGSAAGGRGGAVTVNIYPRALLGTKREVQAWMDEAAAQLRRGGTYVAPAGA